MPEQAVFVGIPPVGLWPPEGGLVSKARLDVHLHPPGRSFAVANDARGHAELLGQLAGHAVAAIGLEASGGAACPPAGRAGPGGQGARPPGQDRPHRRCRHRPRCGAARRRRA